MPLPSVIAKEPRLTNLENNAVFRLLRIRKSSVFNTPAGAVATFFVLFMTFGIPGIVLYYYIVRPIVRLIARRLALSAKSRSRVFDSLTRQDIEDLIQTGTPPSDYTAAFWARRLALRQRIVEVLSLGILLVGAVWFILWKGFGSHVIGLLLSLMAGYQFSLSLYTPHHVFKGLVHELTRHRTRMVRWSGKSMNDPAARSYKFVYWFGAIMVIPILQDTFIAFEGMLKKISLSYGFPFVGLLFLMIGAAIGCRRGRYLRAQTARLSAQANQRIEWILEQFRGEFFELDQRK